MWRIDNPRPAVLVVEDDPDVQANLRDILELDGYQVESAPTVKRALQLEDLARFAVVLLDRRLPDGDAVQLLPHLRHWAPQAAVIIITGCTDLDGAVTALRHGATDYILKPLNPDVLRAAIYGSSTRTMLPGGCARARSAFACWSKKPKTMPSPCSTRRGMS